jgi:hypothetical protein
MAGALTVIGGIPAASATPAAVPGAPAGLTATAGHAQVTLSWAAPASDGGSPVSGYDVYAAASADFEGAAEVAVVTNTAVVLAGLADGTPYYFRVTAVNAAGQSPPSAEASATLPLSAPSSPPASSATTAFAAPTGLTATAGDAQVTLSWAAPASDGGSAVTGYDVYLATAAGGQESAPISTTQGTGGTVTGLTNGTTYYFRVTAVNAAGDESPFSAQVSAEPGRPTGGVTASLTSPATPRQLIVVLAAIAAVAAAGAFTLIARRRRRLRPRDPDRPPRDQARSGQPMAVTPDVWAVPDAVRPDVLSVRVTGREPTHAVRVQSDPGVTTVTIKEGRP